MRTPTRVALTACAAVLSLGAAGCSGDPEEAKSTKLVHVLQSATPAGSDWSYDLESLSNSSEAEFEPFDGQVAKVADQDSGPDGERTADRYGVGWSRTIADGNAEDVCEELADWFESNAKLLPGKMDLSADPVPTHGKVVAQCLSAAASDYGPDASVSDVFATYPNTTADDVQYGLYSQMRHERSTTTVTAALVADKRP